MFQRGIIACPPTISIALSVRLFPTSERRIELACLRVIEEQFVSVMAFPELVAVADARANVPARSASDDVGVPVRLHWEPKRWRRWDSGTLQHISANVSRNAWRQNLSIWNRVAGFRICDIARHGAVAERNTRSNPQFPGWREASIFVVDQSFGSGSQLKAMRESYLLNVDICAFRHLFGVLGGLVQTVIDRGVDPEDDQREDSARNLTLRIC